MRRARFASSALILAAGVSATPLISGELPTIATATSAPSNDLQQRESAKAVDNKNDDAIEVAKLRLREGTRLRDVSGRFRQSGDSLTFIDADNREISGLPNLNLERILRMLKAVEEPESITWSVSGSITEFSGRNYLLISRAVYKAAAPPPAPESLVQPVVDKKL